MSEVHQTSDRKDFHVSTRSLVDAGYQGYLEMGIRRAREADPADITGEVLRTVATSGPIPVFEAARGIVERQVEAGLPVPRDGIAQTAQRIISTVNTTDFFTLYQEEEESVVTMHPADARIIREGIEAAEKTPPQPQEEKFIWD